MNCKLSVMWKGARLIITEIYLKSKVHFTESLQFISIFNKPSAFSNSVKHQTETNRNLLKVCFYIIETNYILSVLLKSIGFITTEISCKSEARFT